MTIVGHIRSDPAAPRTRLPLSPHVFFFIAYNALYLVPLLLAFLLGYHEGGIADVLGVSRSTILDVCWTYAAGMIAFLLGASLPSFLSWSIPGVPPSQPALRRFHIGTADRLAIFLLCTVFVISKAALFPLGVYRSYAIFSDATAGAAWSFSMFCSETMVLAGLLILFSDSKHALRNFILISTLNGINLLHGTRIFFISAVMALVLFGYVNGKITLKRLALYGPLSFAAVLFAAYSIFLARSGASTAGAFSLVKLVSPIVYESVFSQLSLIEVIHHLSAFNELGHPLRFILDVFLFTMPRALAPDKESLLFVREFTSFSPLGAFSGYAHGLIYFGFLFPAFYFLIGLLASCLYRKAEKGSWWSILYIFFTNDFLLRIMRDGYLIPSKMLINTVECICVLIIWRHIAAACSKPNPPVPLVESPLGTAS